MLSHSRVPGTNWHSVVAIMPLIRIIWGSKISGSGRESKMSYRVDLGKNIYETYYEETNTVFFTFSEEF